MSTDENKDWATCRLRNGLNEDCLLKLFEYLNVFDFIQISKVDNYFKHLITKWIIGKRLLNLRGLGQATKDEIFETFGKSMTKFIIYEINLNSFLDTVVKYCSQAKLAELEVNLKGPVTADLHKIKQSMPFFTNLYKIKLNVLQYSREHSFDDFLKGLLVTATNLHRLQLFHVDMDGEWLRTNETKNLRELRLIKPLGLCHIKLTGFIQSLSNLETFIFKGDQDITFIGSTLATFCAKLKNFADIHTLNPHRHFTVGLHRYTFLSSFSQLNHITLTSYTFCGSDLYHPLLELASTNIKKLRIFTDLDHAVAYSGTDHEHIMRSSFAEFRSLRQLEVVIRNFIVTGDLRCEFIMHLAAQLKNLDTFSLECGRLTNASKIIHLLPQINKLAISEVIFKHLPVEMRKIVRTLRTVRQALEPDDGRKVLKLVVNIEQWRELQVYKDINNLVETIIDPFVEPYNHSRRCPSELFS